MIELQHAVRDQRIQRTLNDASIQYESKQFFNPLLEATEKNTHVLHKIATGESKSMNTASSNTSKLVKLNDPIFQKRKDGKIFLDPVKYRLILIQLLLVRRNLITRLD